MSTHPAIAAVLVQQHHADLTAQAAAHRFAHAGRSSRRALRAGHNGIIARLITQHGMRCRRLKAPAAANAA